MRGLLRLLGRRGWYDILRGVEPLLPVETDPGQGVGTGRAPARTTRNARRPDLDDSRLTRQAAAAATVAAAAIPPLSPAFFLTFTFFSLTGIAF